MTDPLVARWADAERILDAVLDLPESEQPAAALARCGDDGELAVVVRRLLDASHADMPAAGGLISDALALAGGAEALPTRVGPFRIVRELGRGGMGRVLLGVREHLEGAPRVAIKVLDRPMAGSDARRRFDRERETLARLEHPHIARLHDGGVTADGTPYLVMEFVEGEPIDRHCETRRLGVEARVRLLRQVCDAVEYAHGRLIVHRDLKPANVMVDAHGQVKLLDFGIAKWLDDLEADSPLTLTAHRVLTPAHAAPEQFRGEAITAATDVYQLGLLLYTVLTGTRAHAVDGASTDAVRRAVCDVDPELPSRAVLARGRTSAEDRTTARHVAGDLDAIVMKALRKDPRDRYATVEALRRDLDHHLADRPVSAHDGTRLYAVRKYVRRHPVPVAAAGGVLLASALALVVVTWQARATAAERDRAVAAEASAEAVNAFLVNELLAAPTPERAQGREVTVVEVLGQASRRVGASLRDTPTVQGDVHETLARSYLALGRHEEARVHAREARRLLGSGGDAVAELRARRLLVDVALAGGAVKDLKPEADAIVEGLRTAAGAAHAETLLGEATRGRVLEALDELSAAESALRAADDLAARSPGVTFEARTTVRSAFLEVLLANGKAGLAEPLARGLIETMTARYGSSHPALVPAGRLHARALTALLEYERAVEATETQVRLHEQLYGPDHPATARAIHDLAVAYGRAARDAESFATSRRALDIRTRTLGLEHPDTMTSMRNVAISLRRSGRPAEALPLYRLVARNSALALGERHPRAIRAADEVGSPLMDLGHVQEARAVRRAVAARFATAVAAAEVDPSLLDSYATFLIDVEPEDLRDPARAVTLARRAVATTGRTDFEFLRTLALALEAAGDRREALATAREASALPDGLQSFVTEDLVVRLARTVEPGSIEPWLLARLERLRRERGPDEYLQVRSLDHLARYYAAAGRPAEAETRVREELDVLARSVPPTHFMVGSAQGELGERLMARGALTEAEPLLLKSFEAHVASRRFVQASRVRARDRLVRLYDALGRPAEARKYRDYVLPTFSDR